MECHQYFIAELGAYQVSVLSLYLFIMLKDDLLTGEVKYTLMYLLFGSDIARRTRAMKPGNPSRKSLAGSEGKWFGD